MKDLEIKTTGPVIYWMSRDQRVNDNWALIFAQTLAIENKSPLYVVFCLANSFLNANLRHYMFMLKGLKETQEELYNKNIPFYILQGDVTEELTRFIKSKKISAVVTDFDPLKIKRLWKKKLIKEINIPIFEVDAHNIVPCWLVSDKKEFSARTFRPKINRLLPDFLTEYPKIIRHPFGINLNRSNLDIKKIVNNLKIDKSIKEVKAIAPGEKNALKTLNRFLKEKIFLYGEQKNNPAKDALSNLSPYLH
ncbi:MAG: deoxyribodipyrimidine photo-lyase, partial [Proteobacteria bacterium]|nr:deoxyribodipyrimidine photo-lyase [Pseudomonadota bacterium]